MNLTRQERTLIWLVKMLYDFSEKSKINYKDVINHLNYNTKNDKAFAVSGRITNRFMRSSALIHPRLLKNATKEIILGGAQNFLSPERRLDAILCNSPALFA